MKSKVILITGGSSGIGKAIGVHLNKVGYTVYGTTRDITKYSSFNHFPLLEMDVRKPETIKNAVQALMKKESKIDVLVNNAGVGITGPMEETPNDEILNAFSINFNGPLNVINAVLPIMRKQGSGLIINITSVAAYMGLPFRGVYSATKSALEVITESYRLETSNFGVHFTTLAPGDFATNIAAGRFHTPVYDDSPYRETYSKTLDAINKDVDSGEDPKLVGEKIVKIINTKNPKPHYRVGSFIQKMSIILKRFLPGRWFEKMLQNHNKR